MSISKNWSLSKTNYYVDFVTVPIVIAASVIISGFSVVWFPLGLLAWSLAEYFIHRYLFHRIFRNEHWLHHINEGEYVGVSAYKSGAILVLLLGIAYLTGTILFFQGVFFGYLLYITIHDAIHHYNFLTSLIPGLKAAHIQHHEKGEEKNFGVITMVWDHLFGTYKA